MITINSFVVCRDVVHLKNGMNIFSDAPVTNLIPTDSGFPHKVRHDFHVSMFRQSSHGEIPFTFNMMFTGPEMEPWTFPPITSQFEVPYLFKELRGTFDLTYDRAGHHQLEYEVVVDGEPHDEGVYNMYAWNNYIEFSEGVQYDNPFHRP